MEIEFSCDLLNIPEVKLRSREVEKGTNQKILLDILHIVSHIGKY